MLGVVAPSTLKKGVTNMNRKLFTQCMELTPRQQCFFNNKKLSYRKVALSVGFALSLVLSGCQKQTSEEHLEAAQVFIQAGDSEAAIVELKNAIQLSPDSAEARFQLGSVYLKNNAFEAAEKELGRALDLGYPSNKVIPLLSRAYQKTGANAALIEVEHDNAELTVVEQIEVGFYKLQSLLRLQKTDEAKELITSLLALDTSSVYKGLVETLSLMVDSDMKAALEKAVVLQKQAPLNKDVLSLTAQLYLLNQQPSEAADVYSEYVKAAPEDIESRFALASLLVEQQRTLEAEPHVDKLLEINQQNGLLNQLKGVIRAADSDFENALKHSQIAIQNGRTDPVVYLVAGFAAFELADYEDAQKHLEQIASLLPDNHPGLRILAASQLQTGNTQEASLVLDRVDNLAAQDAFLLSRAGFDLLQAGDVNSAKSLIDKVETISETTDDLIRLGALKLSLNNIDGVLNLEQAVSKTPKSATANNTLANAYLATNQLDKAAELAKTWQAADPSNIDALLLEGNVAQRNGDLTAAELAFSKASKLAPDEPKVGLALIAMDIIAEDFKAAAGKLDTLTAKNPSYVPALAAEYGVNKKLNAQADTLAKIERAHTQFADNEDLSILYARVLANEERFSDAAAILDKFEPSKDVPLAYWPLKGAVLFRAAMIQEAETHYDNWISFYPKQRQAVLGKVVILEAQNKLSEALSLASAFLEDREDLQFEMVQSMLFALDGDAANAQRLLDGFDDNIKPLPFLRGVAARIALLENRPKDAINDALVAYDDNPSSRNMLMVVAAYDRSQEPDNSYEFLSKHLQANPNDLRAMMLQGERQINKDVAEAVLTYKKALEINPNNFIVLNNLAYILMQEGELEQAAEYGIRAYELRPDNIATADTYAQILIRQNKVEDAVAAYRKVRADTSANEEIYLNFIEALLMNDNKPVAKRRLSEKQFELPASVTRLAELKQTYGI